MPPLMEGAVPSRSSDSPLPLIHICTAVNTQLHTHTHTNASGGPRLRIMSQSLLVRAAPARSSYSRLPPDSHCSTRTHARTHAHVHTHAHTHTRTHAHTHTRTHAHTRTRTHAHTHTRTHAHARVLSLPNTPLLLPPPPPHALSQCHLLQPIMLPSRGECVCARIDAGLPLVLSVCPPPPPPSPSLPLFCPLTRHDLHL